MNQYEIRLKWAGRKKKPHWLDSEYGFGSNPPIVINAKSKSSARHKLSLARSVRIKSIKKVDSW